MSLSAISSSDALTATPLKGDKEEKAKASDGFLGTLIDIINPLQHIPGVSTLYREATGDTMSSAANIVGGGLFGGPIGAAASVVNEIVSMQTGGDIGENVLQQVEVIAQAGANDPYAAAAPVMTPLTPDHGESALIIALTGTEQSSATAPNASAATEAKSVDAINSLERYRDPTLGLKEANKQVQYRMTLDKIAIDMKA